MRPVIEAAKVAIGERCGEDFRKTLQLVADWLNTHGYCAFAGTEAVFLLDPDSEMVEEWHLAYTANGCWTGGNAYKGVHF
jgi:hypothetical protein